MNSLANKNVEIIKESLTSIAAKAQALYLEMGIASEKTIDSLMREIINEAQYVKSKAYQIRKEEK